MEHAHLGLDEFATVAGAERVLDFIARHWEDAAPGTRRGEPVPPRLPFVGTPQAGDVFGASGGKVGALDRYQEKVRTLSVDALCDRVVRPEDLALGVRPRAPVKARATL